MALHLGERHNGEQAPHMEAVGCGIKADVAGKRLFQALPDLFGIGSLSYKPPQSQNIKNIFKFRHDTLLS